MNKGNSIRISPQFTMPTGYGFLSILFLLFSLFTQTIQAQPGIEWDAAYGGNDFEELRGLEQTSDGGFILGGTTNSIISGDVSWPSAGPGWTDFWMVKTDILGNKLWDQRFGGNLAETLQEVKQTSDGGYILGGWSFSGISGQKSQANNGLSWTSDFWIVKTDAFGNILWDKSFGGSGSEQLYHIIETADGGFLLGGYSASGISGDKTEVSRGAWDFWIVKTDASGNKLWDKTFGGGSNDMLLDFQQTSDGGYILGGWSNSNISGDKTQALYGVIDFWVVKTDASGNKLWDRAYGGTGNDQIKSLDQTTDGGYIFAGFSDSNVGGTKSEPSQGGMDYWMVKTNGTGVVQWDKTFGGAGQDELNSIEQTPDGIYQLGGFSDSGISSDKTEASQGNFDYWIIKANSVGSKIWDKTFGGTESDILSRYITTNDGGYLLGGYSASGVSGDRTEPSQGSNDCWVVKLLCDIELDAGQDTIVCPGETVFLDASDPYCFNCNYVWNDGLSSDMRSVSPMTPVTYHVGVTNSFGCTLLDTISIDIYYPDSTFITLESCNPQDTGIVIYTFSNFQGCDSMVFETTILLPTDIVYVDLGSCNPQDTGLVVYNLSNQFGCDSTVFETTDLLPSDTVFISSASCNPQDTGFVIYSLSNQYGCDSTIYEMTNLLISDTVFTTFTSCNPQDTGFVIYSLNNQYGCDSTVFETTILLLSDTLFTSYSSCNPQDTGLVIYSLCNQYGCDSTIFEMTNFLQSDTSFIFSSSCNALDTGIFETLLTNFNGCDSLIINHVEFLESDTTYVFETTCLPQDAGIVETLLNNQNGCDSLVILTTDLLLLDTTFITLSSCDATLAGLDTLQYISQTGCDSVVITTTAYLQSDTTYLYETSCQPQNAGVVETLFSNQNGCDSLVILTTDLLLLDTTFNSLSSCDAALAGIDTLLYISQAGCDSVVITTTAYLQSDTTYLFETSCHPQDVGVIETLFSNQNGCDSLVILTTDLLLLDTTFNSLSSCDVALAGIDTLQYISQTGCDSVVITTTAYLQSDTTYLFETSCFPQDTGNLETLFNNQTGCDSLVITSTAFLLSDTFYILDSSCHPADTGTVVYNYFNQNGCDSIEIVFTELVSPDTAFVLEETCDPNQLGTVSYTILNSEGCDSILIVTTEMMESDLTFLTEFTCFPEEVSVDTTWFNNQLGCDSLVINAIALREIGLVLSQSEISCYGKKDGVVYVDSVPGGQDPVLYSINGSSFYQYPVFENLGAGNYLLQVQDAEGCENTQNVFLEAPLELAVDLGEDLLIQLGDSVRLNAIANQFIDSLYWGISPSQLISCLDCPDPIVRPLQTSNFKIIVINENGCLASDEIMIRVAKDRNVFVPTVFSPNGDGINDRFEIFTGAGTSRINVFRVFSRWGKLLYEEKNVEPYQLQGWDGTDNGKLLNPAVFTFYAELEYLDGRVELITGDVTLLK